MKRRQSDPWNFLFIAGMWFQDLFNYDFRRTEMCIIPYATQQVRFPSARTTPAWGGGKSSRTCTRMRLWPSGNKNHGKHEIYAKGKTVNLQSFEHSLKIDSEDAARVRHLEHDIPVTAAEEDRARRKKAYEEQAKVRANLRRAGAEEAQPTVRADRDGQRQLRRQCLPISRTRASQYPLLRRTEMATAIPAETALLPTRNPPKRRGSRRRRLSILSNSADSNGSVLRMEPLFLGWRNDCVWLL